MNDPHPLAERTRQVREAIDAHAAPLLAGISGVGRLFADIMVTDTIARLGIGFLGWSPTLHGIEISHRREMRARDDQGRLRTPDDLAADIARDIRIIAERQRSRALAGAALGTPRPLKPGVVGHVQVDSAYAALRGETVDRCRAAVLEASRRAHAQGQKHDGGPAMRASGVLIGESTQPDGETIRCILPHVKLRSPDGRKHATLRGFELDIACDPLPETMLVGLPGHRLGELADLHPALDDRLIRKVVLRSGGAMPGIVVTIDINVDPIDMVLPKAV